MSLTNYNSEEKSNNDKIRVTELYIIVEGNKDKHYFEIMYKKVGCDEYTIGYGSYNLDYVFEWCDNFILVSEKKSLFKRLFKRR